MNLQETYDAEELVALARLDIDREDFSSALAKLKSAISMKDVSQDSFSMLAKVYAQLGLYQRAISHFELYLQNNPNALIERFQLGMAQLDAGLQAEALVTWGELLSINADFPPALFYKGLVSAQQGLKDQAKGSLQQLLKTASPDNLYYDRAKSLLIDLDSAANPELPQGLGQSVRPVEH